MHSWWIRCGNSCRQLGQKVAIIEKANLGGVCLNVGCIPSKALINAGHRYENAMHSDDMGITAENVKVDFTKVQEWKNGVVKKLTGGVEGLLKGNKVEIIRGEAYFVDANTLRVMTEDALKLIRLKMLFLQLVLHQSKFQDSNTLNVLSILQVL